MQSPVSLLSLTFSICSRTAVIPDVDVMTDVTSASNHQEGESWGSTGLRRKRPIRVHELFHNRRSCLKKRPGRRRWVSSLPLWHREHLREYHIFQQVPQTSSARLPSEVWVTCGEAWWGLLICLAHACGFGARLTTSPERVLGTHWPQF